MVLCAVPGSFPVQLHPFRARTNCSTPLGCTILLGCHSFSSPTVAATGQKCACVPNDLLFEVRSISLPYYTGRNMRSKPCIHLDAAHSFSQDESDANSVHLIPKGRIGISDISFWSSLDFVSLSDIWPLPWLPRSPRLAVMVFSGLFQDRFIDQVQVVGYLHDQMAMTDRNSGGGIQLGFEMGFGLELEWLWHEKG